MTKDVGVLILGLLVAAMPYLGFPAHIERILFVVIGLVIALLAFLIRGDFSLFTIERSGDTFVEEAPAEKMTAGDGVVTGETSGDYGQEKAQGGH